MRECAACTGPHYSPVAVFEGYKFNAQAGSLGEYDGSEEGGEAGVASLTGAVLYSRGHAAGGFIDAGTVAVTAP